MLIFSDASFRGWGACCEGSRANGPWTPDLFAEHINFLELLAAFKAIQAFTANSCKLQILICIDNVSAVSYNNNMGGTKSHKMCSLARQIAHYCERRDLGLKAQYLSGKLNTIADEQSRQDNDASDWKLDPLIFAELAKIWPMEIDLFAKEWNAQLPSFASWFPQPNAVFVNAFSRNWRDIQGYLFPPFNLIGRCITKIRRELATVVLIAPSIRVLMWFPTPACSEAIASDVKHWHSASSYSGRIIETGRVETIRRHLLDSGLSEAATLLLQSGGRKSTSKAYNSAWSRWTSWCLERDSDPLSGDINNVIEYLTMLYQEGKAFSTINLHKSTLSSTLSLTSNAAIGSNPLIIRLMKSIFENRPP